jgi:3-hydroxyacyl-[acyl-carrier-protein] dehydratase
MSAGELILAPDAIDLDNVIADIATIRKFNPQRFECEQLTAVVYDDPQTQIVVGYKDLTENEFWCRGHLPGMPLMPGVLMCEAAAQLCSYHAHSHGLTNGKILGFGGLDGVRFREVVHVPSRLVIVAQITKMRRGLMIVYKFECFVDNTMVCDGELRGIGLPGTEALPRHGAETA